MPEADERSPVDPSSGAASSANGMVDASSGDHEKASACPAAQTSIAGVPSEPAQLELFVGSPLVVPLESAEPAATGECAKPTIVAGGTPPVSSGANLRRFSAGPGAQAKAPVATWRRHWVATAGFALLLGCLCPLSGGPWPDWHWPGGSQDFSRSSRLVSVVIDPGHGGDDSGAVAQGVVEKDLNLDVGRRVAQALAARGIKVRLTREDDHFISLEERVRIGNSQPGAIFVSIHFNDASGDGRVAMNRASGIETFYCENKAMSASAGGWMWASLFGAGAKADPAAVRDVQLWSVHEGAALAQWIQSALLTSTAAADRGIKERSLYVTRRVRGPAVLVEGGFVSHPAEARLLGESTYRQKLADAIADGIIRYLDGAARQPLPAAVITASLGA